jgi:hypothetical protein
MKSLFSIKVSILVLSVWNGVPQVADWMQILGLEMPNLYAFGNGVSETLVRPPAKPIRP